MLKRFPALLIACLTAATFAAGSATQPTLPPSAKTAVDTLKNSPRHGEWVDIDLPGSTVKLHTFVVYPERPDKAPVVIVIHEIFGMSDWVRSVADRLAGEGFIAIAPDLLSGFGPNGGGTEAFAGDSMRSAFTKLTPDEQVKRLNAVRDYALAQPSASRKSATIGFCWGGGASFNYATAQPDLNGAVVYYGSPPKKELQEKIKCPVLGMYGKSDNRITSTVDPTKTSMKSLGKIYDPHVFDGAGHGFLRQQDEQNGANLKATEQAWPLTITFLKEQLEK